MPPNSIYLASKSPRRRELLSLLGVGFTVLELTEGAEGDIDESVHPHEPPLDYVLRVTAAKARAAHNFIAERGWPFQPILAADTTVALGDEILGKPESRQMATAMLNKLSGTTHQVITVLALITKNDAPPLLKTSVSEVSFAVLSDAEISAYVASGDPMDKAGAYGIQGLAGSFVTHLSGSYSGVMGLPLYETRELLKVLG